MEKQHDLHQLRKSSADEIDIERFPRAHGEKLQLLHERDFVEVVLDIRVVLVDKIALALVLQLFGFLDGPPLQAIVTDTQRNTWVSTSWLSAKRDTTAYPKLFFLFLFSIVMFLSIDLQGKMGIDKRKNWK